VLDATLLCVVGMDLQPILIVPQCIGGPARLSADIVLAQDASGRKEQRESRSSTFLGRNILGTNEVPFATHETADMHYRRAQWCRFVTWPLHRSFAVEQII